MILLNDFRRQWADCGPASLAAMERTGASGWYVLGSEVERFEKALSQWWGLEVVGVGNGLDALEIALRCAGVDGTSKVLTTPLSAYATTLAIQRIGATPVFVDVDQLGQMDLNIAHDACRRDHQIRCVIPVHLYGFPCSLSGLDDLRKERTVTIIEDCAQAIGARDEERAVGTVGLLSATSFYPTKNLGAIGDGGAVMTTDPDLATRCRALRNYGQSSQYVHAEVGLNSRLDELQAAILNDVHLPRLAEWNCRRASVASRYLTGIENPQITLPTPRPGTEPAWHLFPIRLDAEMRDAFRSALNQLGIATGIHYPRLITEQAALTSQGRFDIIGDLANARKLTKQEVSLPIHPYLTDDEVQQIIDACNNWGMK